ncbi:MAG TPA: acyl-CoA dehydrogenase family protein [Caulobacterales bacterium]|nr:acyl-CoA dehydrogenase family protein [Caulobacterales bacterium]
MHVLNVPTPDFMEDEELRMFEDSVERFLDEHATTAKLAAWREAGIVPREAWEAAGRAGLLCLSTSADYGGAGGDFRHEIVLMRSLGRRGIEGWDAPLHNAIVAPYIEQFGSEEQKQRWLPRMASGELISAIAMTEPGTGSDLQGITAKAVRADGGYVINGAKTFITNGQNANIIIVACKTDPTQGAKGISLLVVETDNAPGFSRGRNLDKIGRDMADTSELFFNNVFVPAENLLGGAEGRGFYQLMEKLPQERLIIAVQCMAAIEYALSVTLDYVKGRKAFGKALLEFQNTQFKLADAKTQATIAQVFVDHCSNLLLKGALDSATASMAKYWVSELLCSIVDDCLQLHGGYGYMNEYPIATAYRDARVNRIYGGTSEIMKLLIARTL